jgi:hypothetical protein
MSAPANAAPFSTVTLPAANASGDFWKAWGDGKGELSGYRAIVPRYGALREAELATGLICRQSIGLNSFLNCQIGLFELVRPGNGQPPTVIFRLIGYGATWRQAIGMVKAKGAVKGAELV